MPVETGSRVLAVNTFKRDTRDKNADLCDAVRTMDVCGGASSILRHLFVRHSVRCKTAAVCVAVFDISPELVSEQGFLDQLHDMVSDSGFHGRRERGRS